MTFPYNLKKSISTPPRIKPQPKLSPSKSPSPRRKIDRSFKVTSPGRTPPRKSTPRRITSPGMTRNPNFSPSVSQARNRTLTKLSRSHTSSHHLSPAPPTPRFHSYAMIRKEQARRTRNEERLKTLAYLNGDLEARMRNRKKVEGWKEVGGKVNLTKNFEKERRELELASQRREIPKWKSGMFKEDEDFSNDISLGKVFTSHENADLSSSSFLEPPSTPNTQRNSSTPSNAPSSIGRPLVPVDLSSGINNLLRSHERAREIAKKEFVDLPTPTTERR